MRVRRWRISGVTMLAGAVLLLLPALAWMQYSWLDQIATADRERRERTLRSAAGQLTGDLDGELGRAVSGLQVDGSMLEQRAWRRYAQRVSEWSAAAAAPTLVQSIYIVQTENAHDDFVLRQWMPSRVSFDEVAWPAELQPLHDRLRQLRERPDWLTLRRGERAASPQALGDELTLVSPSVRLEPAEADGGLPSPPDMRLLGFTVLRLDATVLQRELLPALVRRHFFDTDGTSDYRVAVVRRQPAGEVIYESEPGAAQAIGDQADAAVPFMAARLRPMFTSLRRDRDERDQDGRERESDGRDDRNGGRSGNREGTREDDRRDDRRSGDRESGESRERRDESRAGMPPPDGLMINIIDARRSDRTGGLQTRVFGAADAHWRLIAKHRAGSLEAAVAATRARNLLVSSGVLALLATAIGLILVSARRADLLARQQVEFVAAVSHELRTPVSVIGAAAGNLAAGIVGDPARVKTYGTTIEGEARRLAETVERVLQLAGIAAGRAAAQRVPVQPAQLVADVLDACRLEIAASGMRIDVDLANDLPPIHGDAAALKSALQNLVINGLKYARDGGWLRVSAAVHGGAARRSWWRPALSGTFVDLTVADGGPGVDADERKHVFEPFYRGRHAVARQIQGSGLGLNLVRRIAEAHGGSVRLDSEPGRGSRFTLRLPALTSAPVAAPARAHTAADAPSAS